MEKSIRLLIALLLVGGSAFGQVESVTVNGSTRNVNNTGAVNFATGQLKVNGVVMPPSSSGAPVNATYLVQQADSTLTNEVALSALATGLVKSTNISGAISTITDNSANWDTGFSERRQWDGGSTNLTASTGRTSLGATTVGSNLFTLSNPGAITFMQINADNSVTTQNASTFRGSIGAGTGNGSVTSIATTSPVQGGTITTTGTISLNLGVDFSFTTPQSITLTNSATNVSEAILTLVHVGGAVTTGFGNTLWSRLENAGGSTVDAGQEQNNWSTATASNETSYYDWLLRLNGAGLASKMRLFGSGSLSVGSTTDPGTNGIVNAATGFRVNNVALAFSDLSGAASSAQRKLWTNAQTSQQSIATTTDTYLSGSKLVIGTTAWAAGGTYRCRIYPTKASAGTGATTFAVRVGTAGTTSDAAIYTIAPPAGTASADNGIIDTVMTVRTTGASATGFHQDTLQHNVASGGLFAIAQLLVGAPVAVTAFNSGTATTIGVSVVANASGSGTTVVIDQVEAYYVAP